LGGKTRGGGGLTQRLGELFSFISGCFYSVSIFGYAKEMPTTPIRYFPGHQSFWLFSFLVVRKLRPKQLRFFLLAGCLLTIPFSFPISEASGNVVDDVQQCLEGALPREQKGLKLGL
jgi:hypothetical protein